MGYLKSALRARMWFHQIISISSHDTVPRLHWNLHFVPIWPQPTMRFLQARNTKMTMHPGLQSAAHATKNAPQWTCMTRKYCPCHKEQLVTLDATCRTVTKCQRTKRYTWRLMQQSLDTRPHADRGGWLRMVAEVANGCAMSSNHTLHPQPPGTLATHLGNMKHFS